VEEVLWREKIGALQRSRETGENRKGGSSSSGGSKQRQQNSQICSPTLEQVSPKHSVSSVNVGCFAHGNLSADWYAEPGPSTKKRRVDSGFSEMMVVDEEPVPVPVPVPDFMNTVKVIYAGKGKEKMGTGMKVEVISID
jgi:hypothetical protein